MKDLTIIGRVEKISFPDIGVKDVHAKIDTGADTSSLWASNIHEVDNVLKFKMFGRKSPHYTGKEISIMAPHYLLTRVASSFGHKEWRYVVKLQINLGGKVITGTFTLADRRKKTYPILIGRKLLYKKFIVDVSKGTPMKAIEKSKKVKLKKELDIFRNWEMKA